MGKPTQKDAEMLLKLYELISSDKLYDASMWLSFEFDVKNYEEFKEKYPMESEEWRKFFRFGMFYEVLGVLAENGLLNTDMYFDAFGGTRFNKAEPIVKGLREERENPHIFENWESLSRISREYWDKRKPKITEEK